VDARDLVTQAEIARRIGRTRQLVQQYIAGKRGPGGFPPACQVAGEAALWMWCDVAYWLWRNDMIREEELHDAQQLAGINTVLELHRQQGLAPAFMHEVIQAITTRQE
jgi:predicted transcriptional regulator